MAQASRTVNFDALSAGDNKYELSLDADYNEAVYGEAKSTFIPGEVAYLKLLYDNDESYELDSSYGVLRKAHTKVLYEITEDLQFIDEKEAELAYTPEGNKTYEWIGDSGGVPFFNGKKVTLKKKELGILRVTYSTTGDRLKLSGVAVSLDPDETFPVLCLATFESENKVNTTVNYESEESEGEDVDVTIVVRDLCTGDPIEGAAVVIEDIASGSTNADGKFKIPTKLTVGEVYNIASWATGYLASSTDFLSNDKFEVPAPAEDTETTEE